MSNIQNNNALEGQGTEEAAMGPKLIWKVFFILLALTALEFFIALALVHKGILEKGLFVNTIYILLTIAKAYYIIAYFMHLKFEKSGFIICCAVPMLLAVYLMILVFIEGNFLNTAYDTWPLWPN